MDRTDNPPGAHRLNEAEWEVLYLLYDALDQLRKMTLSFSELRYLAVEHPEEEIRSAVASLLARGTQGAQPLVVQVPNLANLPIYRIAPTGRDMVDWQRARATGRGTMPMGGS